MATVQIPISPKLAEAVPGRAFPTPYLDTSNGAGDPTLAIPVYTLEFPDSQLSAIYYPITVTALAANPNQAVTVVLDWYSPTTIVGNVTWRARAAPVNANAAVSTAGFAGAGGSAVAVSGTLGGAVRTSISLSSAGGVNASTTFHLMIYRDGADATDTATGSVRLRGIGITFADA